MKTFVGALATLAALALAAPSPASAQVVAGDCTEAAPAASPARGLFSGLNDILDFGWTWSLRDTPLAGMRWCSAGSNGMPGWATRASTAPSRDATSAFRDAHTKAKNGESVLPANANDYVYVFVGGLYTEHFPGYMRDNIGRLDARGLATRRLDIDSDAGVETNAKAIRDGILRAARETGKKVILLGHSKGGVDTAAALALYPELKPHVKANIAMQAPYGGSPVAQDITGCPHLQQLTDEWVTRVWRGSPQSMRDLTYDARRAFVAANPYPSDIPTISLATSRTSFGTVMRKTELYMRLRYGLKSDGLVAPADAIIPGSTTIVLDDMDHAEATNTGVAGFREYHPGDITEALIAVALSR